MSDDRELLEKAALAAGYDLAWGGPDGDMARRRDTWDNWNPLFNDGDALRLAVKLGISLTMKPLGCMATDLGLIDAYESFGNDPEAATRRAIVRAAASIGPTP